MLRVKRHLYRVFIYVLVLSLSFGGLLCMGMSQGSALAADFQPGKAAYVSAIDELSNHTYNGYNQVLHIVKDYELPLGQAIEMSGWLATAEGIRTYEYAWVSASGGVPDWKTPDGLTIISRKDLTNAEIPYASGHGSAGFALTILPDEGMVDGYYDLYVRGITGGDHPCDLMVLTGVKYGAPDVDENGRYSFSFTRLNQEENALMGCRVENGVLHLGVDGVARLGELNLDKFESIKITYSIPQAFTTEKQAVLGLKATCAYTYGQGTGKYNMTDNICYLPIDTTQAEVVQEIELRLADQSGSYTGELYLCGYISGEVMIHGIELTYVGQGYARTAAKIYFSEDVVSSFGGMNKVELLGVNDAVMGDVLRIQVTEDTNDPYATFYGEALMKEHDIRLTADDYKYIVILAKSPQHNINNNFVFYLCAGEIMGPTEDCTCGVTLHNDDRWHYYVMDLSQKGTWQGTIHNWRVDILNGNCQAGNYVDIASIQFFRTSEAAALVAGQSTTTCETPYAKGQAAVIRDDCENGTDGEEHFVISSEDSFVWEQEEETQPVETQATLEEITSEALPFETNVSMDVATEMNEPEAQTQGTTTDGTIATNAVEIDTSNPAETQQKTPPAEGCASLMSGTSIVLLMLLFMAFCLLKNPSTQKPSCFR